LDDNPLERNLGGSLAKTGRRKEIFKKREPGMRGKSVRGGLRWLKECSEEEARSSGTCPGKRWGSP